MTTTRIYDYTGAWRNLITFIEKKGYLISSCERCGKTMYDSNCVSCNLNGIFQLINWIAEHRAEFVKCAYCGKNQYFEADYKKSDLCETCLEFAKGKWRDAIKTALNLENDIDLNDYQTQKRFQDQIGRCFQHNQAYQKIDDGLMIKDIVRMSDYIALNDRVRELFTDGYNPKLLNLYKKFNDRESNEWFRNYEQVCRDKGYLQAGSKTPGIDVLHYIEREFPKDARKSKMLPILAGTSFEYDSGDPEVIKMSEEYFIQNAEAIAKSVNSKTLIVLGHAEDGDSLGIDAGKFKKLMIANKGVLRQITIENARLKIINNRGYAELHAMPYSDYILHEHNQIIIQ